MARILGIDPGSQITGFGIIDFDGVRSCYLISGCVRARSGQSLPQRLRTIFAAISELIETHRPEEMAIERVFMHRNADAALKLGQARGAVICAGALVELPIDEYAPRTVKQAVVGYGGASKEQVQHMVCALLKLSERPQSDAADALAVALCHGHSRTMFSRNRLPAAARAGRRR